MFNIVYDLHCMGSLPCWVAWDAYYFCLKPRSQLSINRAVAARFLLDAYFARSVGRRPIFLTLNKGVNLPSGHLTIVVGRLFGHRPISSSNDQIWILKWPNFRPMSRRCPGGDCQALAEIVGTPGGHHWESCRVLLIFFNQSVGSIACYINRQVRTLNPINHCNQRCHGTLDPQQQIVIKMLWYQWGIVCKQSNVQLALLNFSLCYEWFNFYNPLLFSLHPTSLSKWKSQLIILTCPAMIQRSPGRCLQVAMGSPLSDFPCLGCRQITPGSPSGVPTENGGCPCGRLWVFFRQLHPKFPQVAERRPAGDWAAPCGTPADELIYVTSADHPAKFNCELKFSGRRRMSKGWALQECLFGRRPPRFFPDLMQKLPRGDPTIDFSLLGRQLKLYSKPKYMSHDIWNSMPVNRVNSQSDSH